MTTLDDIDQDPEHGNESVSLGNEETKQSDVVTDETEDQSIGHMRDEALRRKERLRQLRMKNASQKSIIHLNTNNDGELPKPIFRNYKPQSEELKDGELPAGKPIDLNKHIIAQLEAADAPVIVDEVNLTSLAPRKPDWDLKRGVEKKLRKLERRTQRAIAELIRERLLETSTDSIELHTNHLKSIE
uniref:SJCHGC05178 protein n=1 Tax=Schistosoma japonicum TaxID=6182 RepID=Q5DDJ8_SCHJA|nr:SJCHGC05178 protein [Schistosoma japonicum]